MLSINGRERGKIHGVSCLLMGRNLLINLRNQRIIFPEDVEWNIRLIKGFRNEMVNDCGESLSLRLSLVTISLMWTIEFFIIRVHAFLLIF